MAHLSDRQKTELVRQHQDGVPWTRLAEHSGVAVRTLQRWAARMETGQAREHLAATRDRRALPPNW
ncbi:helix-turn-helix domain-containing protein [Microbacterium aurum]